jgi:hyperosmotically inducible periplasmic protein
MKTLLATTCVLCGVLLGPGAVVAADQTDTARATAYVEDSAVTTAIKTKLAAEHITSLARVHVDTDKDGVVWLSGSVGSQAASDKIESIARNTEHVKSVHNDIKIDAGS